MPPPAPRRVPRGLRSQGRERLRAMLGAPIEPLTLGWTPDTELDESPPPLVDPGRRGVVALALTAAVVLAVVAVTAWRHRPQPVPAPLVLPSSSAASGLLVVDVEGAVRRPGLLTLPRGSRVADAVRAAGGLRPGVTTAGVNLARPVVDGEQLVIGPTASGGGGAGPTAGGLLDLNTATVEQLDALPGVGPVLAQRIVDWRTAHGPFRDVGQLREVSGIGEAKYADLEKKVRV